MATMGVQSRNSAALIMEQGETKDSTDKKTPRILIMNNNSVYSTIIIYVNLN